MRYLVTAKYDDEKLEDLYKKLNYGSILKQKPDGHGIVDAMRRARIVEPGVAQWTETCFCTPPLNHERETVLDGYFTDFDIVAAHEDTELEGEPLFRFSGDAVETK